MDQTIKINVKGAKTLPLDALQPFQGELKRLERHEYEQLRKNLIEEGFSFTIHVWEKDGVSHIIDGHQRVFALKHMRDVEHWSVPELPVSVVEAPSFQAAKKKILAGTSQYGKMTVKSLADFLKENDIPFDDVVATFHFPEVSMDELSELITNIKPDEALLPTPEELGVNEVPELRSASENVKQVQLYFATEEHSEFMIKTDALATALGLESISDAVLEVIREAYSTRIQKQ